MKHLVIVESAAKAQTIAKYLNAIPELGAKYEVVACLGHIQDLPAKQLGINKDTWDVTYEPNVKKASLMLKIKRMAKEALDSGGKVYLASDMDLEGHAIANHLKACLKLKARDQYDRVCFNEITKSALKTAFTNPTDIDLKAVAAQETRRILDRLVGYELSPLLWRRFTKSNLSAGRVQSAALKLVVDRYNAHKTHQYEPSWQCHGIFVGATGELSARTEEKWDSAKDAYNILANIVAHVHANVKWTAEFNKTRVRKSPPVPFTTSTLQQDCFNYYGMSSKYTMQVAQFLYEAGLITYMRTDSTFLSSDAIQMTRDYVNNAFGATYVYDDIANSVVPHKRERKKTNKDKAKESPKHTQEAHEAIRPTSVNATTHSLDSVEGITTWHKKVYDLIWRRTVASQMAAAIYSKISYRITGSAEQPVAAYPTFYGSTSALVFDGFLKVMKMQEPTTSNSESAAIDKWDDLLRNKNAVVLSKSLTMVPDVIRPKPLYNEATFVQTMEKEGIGRPSTYASVVDKLFEKGYVVKSGNSGSENGVQQTQLTFDQFMWTTVNHHHIDRVEVAIDVNGTETNKMTPTSIGERVVDYLATVTPYLLDPKFTRLMETDLDRIVHCDDTASPIQVKIQILKDFYKIFSESCDTAASVAKESKNVATKTGAPDSTKGVAKSLPSLKSYPGIGVNVVNTRYGHALYAEASNKFYSIAPFLEWKGIQFDDMTDADVRFIVSLPHDIPGCDATWGQGGAKMRLQLGRYGLYIQQGDKNLRLNEALWQKGYEGTLTYADIQACPPPMKSSMPPTSGKPRQKYSRARASSKKH